MTERIINISKNFTINHIHEDSMRKFSCWGSVQVKDRQGEIIPIEEIQKTMDFWMDRGAPINLNHTNQQVGRGLSYSIEEKDGIPGVLIVGKIFNHYAEDDIVWEGIKKGDFEGLSIGGKAIKDEQPDGTYLRNLVGFEFSIVERTGNQEATFVTVNTIAKSDTNIKMVKKEEQKTEENSDNEYSEFVSRMDALEEAVKGITAKMSGTPDKDEEEETEKTKKVEKADEDEEEKESEADDEETEKTKKAVKKTDTDPIQDKGLMEEFKKEFAELKKSIDDMKERTIVDVVKTARPSTDTSINNTSPVGSIKPENIALAVAKGQMTAQEAEQKLYQARMERLAQ